MSFKKEIEIFLSALMFYTRIPCPFPMNLSQENLNASSRYFPLMGWIVGGIAALTFWAAHWILPVPVSILLSMIVSVLVTGAFHEDAFADMCDGFGGGWTKQEILDIMKDSRIGTYGTLGLIFILSLKFLLLWNTAVSFIPMVLWVAHSLSRFAVTILKYRYTYVRDSADSKAKPMAEGITAGNLGMAALFGIFPLIFTGNALAFILILPSMAVMAIMGAYFHKRIGGYTGDCLGATQQLCEITVYLSFLILWKFI